MLSSRPLGRSNMRPCHQAIIPRRSARGWIKKERQK